jgi:hypothetical protein
MGIGIGNGALLQIPCLFRIKLDVGAQFKGVRLLLAKASNRKPLSRIPPTKPLIVLRR